MAKRKQPKGVRPKPKSPWVRKGEIYSNAPTWSDACGPITVENGYSDADVYELSEERRQARDAYQQSPSTKSELSAEDQARIDFLAEQEALRMWYHTLEGLEDIEEEIY